MTEITNLLEMGDQGIVHESISYTIDGEKSISLSYCKNKLNNTETGEIKLQLSLTQSEHIKLSFVKENSKITLDVYGRSGEESFDKDHYDNLNPIINYVANTKTQLGDKIVKLMKEYREQ